MTDRLCLNANENKIAACFLTFKQCFMKHRNLTQFPNIIKLYSNFCGCLLSVLPFGNDFLSSSVTHGTDLKM